VASSPTGTLTFLFTDIEGSTKLWENDPEAMQAALVRHDEILAGTISDNEGYVFKTVGDAFCAAFPTATDALEAALQAQHKFLSSEWERTGPLGVRMALHTGAAEERDGDYFGPPVNRVARLLSAAHGAQVLLSLSTQELVRDRLPAGTSLRDLGEHRLKDLFRPERVFHLIAPNLPSGYPPLRTLEARPNNLPLQPTPLVGRERGAREVAERLRGEEVRLLTLTGPGGTGKTRLALQASADLLEEFEDGVFFVAMATVTDPELVPSTIAEPLGIMESAGQSLIESLESYLHQKHMLLVLDNLEQVLDGVSVAGELVAACPNLKVLATSRIPLRLSAEQEYPVPPLSLPDPSVLPNLEVITQYEAVRLFVERARAIKVDFEVTNENAPAVAEICARLDGLPLAIELAAARVRLLSPHDMLTRLGNRLKLLKGGPRDLPTRQQTLRGTIDWSYELLEEEEKTLFGTLSVFSGGRTLEAIEEICDPEGDLDALEGVESLLEKSLLRREEGAGGESRFVMLETVHEYAREKLEESAEAEKIKRLHAEYFLALAEGAFPELGARISSSGWSAWKPSMTT
jgi:predicted ATPase/class 3 adenylate cyclase